MRRCAKDPEPDPGFSYNGITGTWWLERAANRAHQRAYRNIADFIRESVPRDPRLIVDYACGGGALLFHLSQQFPNSRLIGLDGSSRLLNLAKEYLSGLDPSCAQRVSLIETRLPGRRVDGERADLAVYCFPNMIPFSEEEKAAGPAIPLSSRDQKIARYLATIEEPGEEDEEEDSSPTDLEEIQHTLEYGRRISRNLRQWLRPGGICIRVEYATSQRHCWSPSVLAQVCYEEGSLDTEVAGLKPRPWFRVLASAYFRSRVLEDVYQQTGDPRDQKGGYLITALRAL